MERATVWARYDNDSIVANPLGTVLEVCDRYAGWQVRRVRQYDSETFTPTSTFVHKRCDLPPTAAPIGRSNHGELVQNHEAAELLERALWDVDYTVAAAGAFLRGGVVFWVLDVAQVDTIVTPAGPIYPFLALAVSHRGAAVLRPYAVGYVARAGTLIDLGWLTCARMRPRQRRQDPLEVFSEVQDDLRGFLDLDVLAAVDTVERLTECPVGTRARRSVIDRVTPPSGPRGGRLDGKRRRSRNALIELAEGEDPRSMFPGTLWGLYGALTVHRDAVAGFRSRDGVSTGPSAQLAAFLDGRTVRRDTAFVQMGLEAVEATRRGVTVSTRGIEPKPGWVPPAARPRRGP